MAESRSGHDDGPLGHQHGADEYLVGTIERMADVPEPVPVSPPGRQFVADIAYLGSENAPNTFPAREQSESVCASAATTMTPVSQQAVRELMTVKDGRLVLPSGMSYRVLVLPQSGTMTPALLTKIRDLALDGATIVGAPPSSRRALSDIRSATIR